MLLNLVGLRRGSYTDLLWRYARRDASLPLNGARGVGMQAEQVLYSWMSIDGSPGHGLFGRLPCGFNVQIGSWPSAVGWAELDHPLRRCADGCHILHGAGGEGKAALGTLDRALKNGRSCAAAFEAVRARKHYQLLQPSQRLQKHSYRA